MAREPRQPYLLTLVLWWLPIVAALAGAAWTIVVYLQGQAEARNHAAAAIELQNKTRLLELQRPYLDKQLALFLEAAGQIGTLSDGKPSEPKWAVAEQRLTELRYGAVALFDECGSVSSLIDTFRNRLTLYKAKPDYENLQKLVLRADEAVTAMRDRISDGWTKGIKEPQALAKEEGCGSAASEQDEEDAADAKKLNIKLPAPP